MADVKHVFCFFSKTSGQLLLEEYHALAMVGKGGLGTLTMDGNTRLCTATAATAMVRCETYQIYLLCRSSDHRMTLFSESLSVVMVNPVLTPTST